MSPRGRLLLLLVIMTFIVIVVESITVGILYHTAVNEERSRLEETAKSQARFIEAVARFNRTYNRNYPYGPKKATLSEIKDAHARYRGIGVTGEFTLSTREDDQIIFLLSHRHYDLEEPKPVPWNSELAEPMRLALSGKSGTVIGLDYRGEKVLAAYEPVSELNLGIVAKIDIAEIRSPFIKAIFLSSIIAIVVIALGAGLFFEITNPILRALHNTIAQLEKTLSEVKTLRGILPICSYCKKVRNDKGYWDQVEVYVKDHTEADFSHGICPDCLKEHFPELRGKAPTEK